MDVYPFDPPPNLLDTLILLALRDHPRHGYDIEACVITSSAARIKLSSGTVYKALPRLCREQNIRRQEDLGPRGQRYYELTTDGRRRLAREINVLRDVIRLFDQPYARMD